MANPDIDIILMDIQLLIDRECVKHEEKYIFNFFADPDPAYTEISWGLVFLIAETEADYKDLMSGFLQDSDFLKDPLVIIQIIIYCYTNFHFSRSSATLFTMFFLEYDSGGGKSGIFLFRASSSICPAIPAASL